MSETGWASEDIIEAWQATVGRTNYIFWRGLSTMRGEIKDTFLKFCTILAFYPSSCTALTAEQLSK